MTMFFLYHIDPLFIATVFPAIALLIFVFSLNDKEQISIDFIIRLLLMGFLATVLASVLEGFGEGYLASYYPVHSMAYALRDNFLVIGLSEEGSKYLLMRRETWNHRSFHHRYNGILYAVSVSLGFALLENVFYVLQSGWNTAIVRGLTAIPGHACFGVCMGSLYGLAKQTDNRGHSLVSLLLRILALCIPALLHGSYDFILDIQGRDTLFVLYIILLFVFSYHLVRTSSKHNPYI